MDAGPISPEALFAATLGFPGPQLLDVRPEAAFAAAEHALPRALRRDPESVAAWAGALEAHRPVIAYCLHGHAASQEVAAAPALLAHIIRGADTERQDPQPAAGGPFAAALGFPALIPDDHALLRHAFPLCDALYLWCRDLQQEVHRWQPAVA